MCHSPRRRSSSFQFHSLQVVIAAASLAIAGGIFAADAPTQPRKAGGKAARGAAGQATAWWREIDTGPFIADTILSARDGEVAALKGLAIKLGPARDVSVVFDTELLAWRAGFDGVITLDGTAWSGTHGGNSHYPNGEHLLFFQNPTGLGVAVNGDWSDVREPKAGPLPRNVARYRGLFRHGNQTVIHYTIGGVNVLELPAIETIGGVRAITRTVNSDATPVNDLELLARVAAPASNARLKSDAQIYLVGAPAGVTLKNGADGRTTVAIAKGTGAARFKIVYAERAVDPAGYAPPADLSALTHGGPSLYPQSFAVKGQLDPAAATKSYAVDVIPLPSENPWKSPPRFGGFDFFPDGKRIAASTWNGDVWIADGIDGDLSQVKWRRFASGMYQTLGLKIVDGVIYTQGRDQITRLRDLNGDGEADSYECFNNDVMITSGFHEFSFDLQTDAEGNFYFSKAMPVNQGGRGFMPWTPHNGTVMKVSKDGSKLEVVAWGFRAPGGVGVGPGGIITTGENEGSFVPACKITWTKPGTLTFNGVVPSKWEKSNWLSPLPGAPTDYQRPLCWIPYYADNSSGSQAWVPENTTWDPRHAGEMLHLSYGKSSIFRVLREEVNGVMQGGVYRLPIDVSAAVMRARFHPQNGQLYVIGFRGWQTNGRDAFQRIRYTGVNTPLPVELHAHQNGLLIRFSAPLDPKTAEDPSRYSLSKWNYVWGPQYGSGRFSIDQRDYEAEQKAITVASKGSHNMIDAVTVGAARLLEDGRSVFLYLPKMTPAMQMELKLDLTDPKGGVVRETIYHTVHEFGPEFKIAGVRWEDIRIADSAPVGEPGLAMSFNAEITDTLRVDQLALTVPEGASPSVFITPRAGAFGAAWQGTIIAPERDDFTFSLEGVGTVSLIIDGKPILSGALPVTAGAPVTLAKGAHSIYCSYTSPANGEARVRLMWSSPQFRTEPVPPSAFRFIPGAEIASWGKVRAGRQVFASAQCIKCHTTRGGVPRDVTPELLESAPDFKNVGNRLERDWIEQWVAQPQGRCPSVAPAQAGDVAAYLATVTDASESALGARASSPASGKPSISADASSIAAGAALVEKLHLGFWVEPLTSARKHTDAGLIEQLMQPALHYPNTVFPDVRLTRAEASQIAAYVRSKQPSASRSAAHGNAAAGEKVVAAACAVCHAPAAGGSPTAPGLEELARSDWTVKGCLAENRGRAPNLHLTSDEVATLIAFRNADRDVGMGSLRRFAPAEYAASQMKRLNCVQCHSGGGENKIPDITYAGEKLDREWLADLIAGKHPNRIRPWMEARMPAFASRATNLSLGLAAKHGVPLKTAAPGPKPELIPIGAKIAGAEGYSCIACHDAGSRKALQVFEGQGPNLQHAPERLRYDYYQRWTHWPQRVAPSTIMPRYTKDRDHALLDAHFEGNAEKQFEAVWQWMQSLGANAQ
jgi:mono/diheme cytochrome c family protein